MHKDFLLNAIFFVAGGVVGAICATAGAFFLFKRFKERLKKYVAEIAGGNLDYEYKTLDSFFGDLKLNINSLTNEIETNYDQIFSGTLYSFPREEKYGGIFKRALARAERFLSDARLFLDDFTLPVIVLDSDCNVKYVNRAAAKYTVKSSAIGRSFYCCFDLADERNSAVCDAARTKEASATKTQLFTGEKVFEVSCEATPILDKDGDLSAIVVYIIDYTDVYATNKFAGIYKEFEEKRVRKLIESIDSYVKTDAEMSGFDVFVKRKCKSF
jgi:PAS domain-containing protein